MSHGRSRRPNIPVIFFDSSTGQYRLNREWSSAYGGRSRVDRINLLKGMMQDATRYRMRSAVREMRDAGVPEYQDIELPDTGDPTWDVARVEADYLNYQLQAQAQQAEELGDDGPGGWRGVLSDALESAPGQLLMRGLDLASRPLYAIAEGADRAAESFGEGPNLDFFRGAWEGISGREKTTFADVLEENEILRGRPGAVAGFALDVGADPTTYLTLGTSTVARRAGQTGVREGAEASARALARPVATQAERQAVEETARIAASNAVRTGTVRGPFAQVRAYRTALRHEFERAGLVRRPMREVIADINSAYGGASVERTMRDRVTEALSDPFWSRSTQRKISRTARRNYEAGQRAIGEAIDPAVRTEVGRKAVQQAREEFTQKVGADVMSEIAARKALRENVALDLRFMGRRIASSKLAGRALYKAGRGIRATRPMATLARTFRTDAEIGQALHRIQRQHYNVSAAQFEAEARQIKDVYRGLGLSRKQREQISRALETGDTKGFTDQMIEGYDAARRFFRTAFDREVEAGVLAESDFADNYLYHVYRDPNFSRGIGSWVRPTGRGAQKFRTLDEAARAGARPLTDVADILVHRVAKSHRVSASHLMMRTIATRFGIDLSGRSISNRTLRGLVDEGILIEGSKIGNGVGRFFKDGTFFDQDVAASLRKMEQIFSNDELISKFGRLFDNIQARVKFLQTAPNPGFHIRNTMSDAFMNFLDGVTTLRPYRQAIRLISSKTPQDGVMVSLRNGIRLTGDDVLQLYDGMGLRAGFFHAEANIIPGMGSRVLTGSSNVIRRASEIREDVMRMAHFLDALKKVDVKVGQRVEEAAELAAMRVRKYNFDYQDLTNIERRVFRRAVPFYTFMRKNVPLMLESYLTRPGRMIVPAKGERALARFLGNDNRDEPLPGMISATPEWISRIPGVEVTEIGPENDPVFMQPDMPYNQLDALFGGFTQGSSPMDQASSGVRGLLREMLLEQSTPLVRTAAEYATQTDLSTGADQPQSPLDAVINQFPVGRLVQRPLSGAAPGLFLQSDRPGAPTYNVGGVEISETVANYITGLGFRKVTPERMQSELRRRQDVIEALLREMRDRATQRMQEEWEHQYGPSENYGVPIT